MSFEDLKNPELQERLKAAKTIGELAELVKAEGVDLSDEMLQAIAGGFGPFKQPYDQCPENQNAICSENQDAIFGGCYNDNY